MRTTPYAPDLSLTAMTAVPLTVVWDDRFEEYDFGAEHPFSERSRGLSVRLLKSLVSAPGSPPVEWVRDVEPASRAVLETFHRPGYLDFVEEASLAGLGLTFDRGDTPAFPGCYSAASRLVAGAVRGLEAAREGGPAFHPGGGLHHARPDRASGFCIFNDVAIAVGEAIRAGLKVAYVDLDAHHGDGVMYGFYRSGRVLDIDFHQDGRTLFPGTGFPEESGSGDGGGLKVNLPFPPLAGDEALLPLFRRIALPLLRQFRPDLLIVQHGVDGHVGDPLTQLQYTPAAYEEIDRSLGAIAQEVSGGRILVTGGGGYRPESVSRVLATTGAIFARAPVPSPGEDLPLAWRFDFHQTLGAPAPPTWGTQESLVRSPWNREDEATLVAAIEERLGQRFRVPS